MASGEDEIIVLTGLETQVAFRLRDRPVFPFPRCISKIAFLAFLLAYSGKNDRKEREKE